MEKPQQSLSVWQLFVLVLSVTSLALLAFESFFDHSPEIFTLLRTVDNLICLIFFSDFILQLVQSKSKSGYLKWGWLDLVSSIPMVPILRTARLVRIARIVRILRTVRAAKGLLTVILVDRAKNTFITVLLGSILLLLLSVTAVTIVEASLAPIEAFWWCLFTLITGEYGDFYPASAEGRVIAVLLMTAGFALFGTLTASIAAFFLGEDQQRDEDRDNRILEEISLLRAEIAQIRKIEIGDKSNG